MVNDDGVAVGAALLIGPAKALGEAGVGIRQEKLRRESAVLRTSMGVVKGILQCHHP